MYTHNCYLPVLQYCRTELGIFVETKMSLKRYCYELLYSLNFIPFWTIVHYIDISEIRNYIYSICYTRLYAKHLYILLIFHIWSFSVCIDMIIDILSSIFICTLVRAHFCKSIVYNFLCSVYNIHVHQINDVTVISVYIRILIVDFTQTLYYTYKKNYTVCHIISRFKHSL